MANIAFEKGFGVYNKVVVVNNASKEFQQSPDFGAAAVMKEDGATGTITLSNDAAVQPSGLQPSYITDRFN